MLDVDYLELFLFLKPSTENLDPDTVPWLYSSSGEFSIKIACECYSDCRDVSHSSVFQKVWKVNAPKRIQTFL